MMLFEAHYYVVTTGNPRSRKHQVILEAESWEQARRTITQYEEHLTAYSHVEFESLAILPETELWTTRQVRWKYLGRLPEHRCGLQGYDPMQGDRCEACLR